MIFKKMSRRLFIKIMGLGILFMSLPRAGRSVPIENDKMSGGSVNERMNSQGNLGVDSDGYSRVYLAKGHSPENNMKKVVDLHGGIEKLIGKNDIVVLKPNAQWWKQGMTNTDAMSAFIEMVLDIPGFEGEVIIAENHQYADPDSRGWTTAEPNGKLNLNGLVDHFQEKGHKNVTKYHWACGGPNPFPRQGDSSSESRVVSGPGEGDGYVWSDKLVYRSPLDRKCMMTYPVFTSSYSGVTIDLKNGAWKDGAYTGQPVKFINFSALNHHGSYCGITASIKNMMGVVDMTCGFQGSIPEGYWNTHYIGIRPMDIPFSDYLPWRVKTELKALYEWKYFYHAGAVLGYFMNHVRMPDLHVITAHWVGYGSRTDRELSGYPKAILASKDPVALDYVASKEILLPLTREKRPDDSRLIALNDITDKNGPAYKFSAACNSEGIGTLDENRIKIITG